MHGYSHVRTDLKPSPLRAYQVSAIDDKTNTGGPAVIFVSAKDNKRYNGTTDATGKFSILPLRAEL